MCSGKTQPGKVSDASSLASEKEDQPSRPASDPKNQSHSSEKRRVGEADAVISHIQKPESPGERSPVSKVWFTHTFIVAMLEIGRYICKEGSLDWIRGFMNRIPEVVLVYLQSILE